MASALPAIVSVPENNVAVPPPVADALSVDDPDVSPSKITVPSVNDCAAVQVWIVPSAAKVEFEFGRVNVLMDAAGPAKPTNAEFVPPFVGVSGDVPCCANASDADRASASAPARMLRSFISVISS